ncbi:MAG: hypothetical protein QXL43_01145 [Methanolinea sp.]
MSTERYFTDHPARARRVKVALGCRCEICGDLLPPDALEVHSVPPRGERENREDPARLEGSVLFLCPRCHADVHEFDVPPRLQRRIVRARDPSAREEIRRILARVPRPYTPPETDIEEAYREACSPRFRFGV